MTLFQRSVERVRDFTGYAADISPEDTKRLKYSMTNILLNVNINTNITS